MIDRILAVAICCFAFLGVAFVLHGSTFQISRRAVEPVTITYQEVQYRPDSRVPGLAFTILLGVRSDGSFSRARYHEPALGAGPYFTLQIADASAAKHIVVDPYTKSISTVAYHGAQADSARIHPANSCPGSPAESVAGYPTTLEQKETDFPGQILITKKWRSAKLDCLVLREETQLKRRSGKTSLKVLTATLVTLGTPADWMFQIPAGYTERSPNQILAEAARRKGISAPWDPRLDENYYIGAAAGHDK